MKPYYLLTIIATLIFNVAEGQTQTQSGKKEIKYKIGKTTVVKDGDGLILPYAIWSQILMTGKGDLLPEQPGLENTAFVLKLFTPEERAQEIANLPKPEESPAFKTASAFATLKEKAIDGYKVDTKALAGKIFVLNFWFIGCPPCRAEIPDLNELTIKYKDNPNVVFVAIALDEAYDVKKYIKDHPLGYHIIDRGMFYAQKYGVNAFPTNVVIGKDSKVVYSCLGGSPANVIWIGKSIEQALATPALASK